ncbi:GntR family transcriptional regulator [Cloacibacillus porcorum]|uniref:GntR family transcriptional regulator n=1 Tax=Cloacibacillus porcorum TaxID=1197717 RepID=UPI0022E3CAC0|nr:GntR family transcriptional regulator [Cloacibacillus porcorum]
MDNAEERAYRFIINAILTGEFNPGDFLLELDLAAKLGMSRTPVNKALGLLVSEGFLNKSPKKGCYVPLPTPHDAELVFTARQVAEGAAAELAAKLVTTEEIEALEEILSKDTKAFEENDKQLWASINEDFHLSIARFSHNAYIEKWVRNMFWRSNIYVFYFDSFYRASDIAIVHETPQQHAAIIGAIKRHDPEEAGALMRRHIQTTFSKLLLR